MGRVHVHHRTVVSLSDCVDMSVSLNEQVILLYQLQKSLYSFNRTGRPLEHRAEPTVFTLLPGSNNCDALIFTQQ